MALDLHSTAQQIEAMAQGMRARGEERAAHLDTALERLAATDSLLLERRRQEGQFTWLAAGLEGELARAFPPPPLPADHTILAVDGSHIDVDRHSPARCYLINIGRVHLRYGSQWEARLESHPRLYIQDDELVLEDPEGTRDQVVQGTLLGTRRTVEELRALEELAGETPEEVPTLALVDGSLILWDLAGQAYPEFVRKALLEEGVLPALEALSGMAQRRLLSVAAYVSLPRSGDVVSALRLAVCPYETVNCDHYCRGLRNGQRPCDVVAGVLDRDLFAQILKPGERSAIFRSTSSIVEGYYGKHAVAFFYLNVGQEIARVEVPAWVAGNEQLLGLTHAALLAQCDKGQGYPVALAEAHEQAVVTGQDRQQFQFLVDQVLAAHRLPTFTSEKARSKRTRWI